MYTPTFLPAVSPSTPDPDPFPDPEHADIDPVDIPDTPLQGPTSQRRSFDPTLVAAAQSLPPVLSALGIGCARFLKGVIPVLAEWLALPLHIGPETGCVPDDDEEKSSHDAKGTNHCGTGSFTANVTLHLATLSSLLVLFRTCTPRIGGWSTTIVDAIGRCWIGCLDFENQKGDYIVSKDSLCVLKKQLKETIVQLARVHPSVIKVCLSVIVLMFSFIFIFTFELWPNLQIWFYFIIYLH